MIMEMYHKANELEKGWQGQDEDIDEAIGKQWIDLQRAILCTLPRTPAGAAAKLRVAFRSFDEGELTGVPERLALRQVWEYLESI